MPELHSIVVAAGAEIPFEKMLKQDNGAPLWMQVTPVGDGLLRVDFLALSKLAGLSLAPEEGF